MKSIHIQATAVLFAGLILFTGCKQEQTCSENTQARYIDTSNLVLPHQRQVNWQQMEFTAFVHFNMNTFTNVEWGKGDADPSRFNPSDFDAEQWVEAFKEAGMKMVILTAKHHDGFCLWPSEQTDYTIENSPYKNGNGDIVKEVSDACRKHGLKFGFYLSPWDRHEPKYGTDEYNEFYKNQLRELLTGYGKVHEVWFDGAKGPDAKDMEYDFQGYWSMVRKHQPQAVIFSDKGPDVRWIGNEDGIAGKTNWSLMDTSKVEVGNADTDYLNSGDPNGSRWVVGECDVSISSDWFYHDDSRLKTVEELLNIYEKSVGRNGLLLLNVPPDQRGLLPEAYVERLHAFADTVDEIYNKDLALDAKVKPSEVRTPEHCFSGSHLTDTSFSTVWAPEQGTVESSVELAFSKSIAPRRILIQENINYGQRVREFAVDIRLNGQWKTVRNGTTIGYKRIMKLPGEDIDRLRVRIEDAKASPVLSRIALY
ncbi:MAG: alpha-L-fucosidase [Bacteroidales bacterium]|nr:alpha-L-fucosidase [Bacteroidales bacterium]